MSNAKMSNVKCECQMSNATCQMSKIKCQMSIRLTFCRSVPPEFLQSFLGLDLTF